MYEFSMPCFFSERKVLPSTVIWKVRHPTYKLSWLNGINPLTVLRYIPPQARVAQVISQPSTWLGCLTLSLYNCTDVFKIMSKTTHDWEWFPYHLYIPQWWLGDALWHCFNHITSMNININIHSSRMRVSINKGFLEWGYLQIINFSGIFPNKSQPAIKGYPHAYGNPQMRLPLNHVIFGFQSHRLLIPFRGGWSRSITDAKAWIISIFRRTRLDSKRGPAERRSLRSGRNPWPWMWNYCVVWPVGKGLGR